MSRDFIVNLVIAMPVALVVSYLFSSILWGRWFEREKRKIERGG